MASTDATPIAPPAAPPRRLAAVVFTDVVGYSAMVQGNEAHAVARVRADLEAMVALAAQRHGECLNRMGDGLMLSFASAIEAVDFALQAQQRFAVRNAEAAAGDRVRHRVGIHLGDVLQMPDGLLAGDGVNIAARLEAVAPAGGVAVSQAVYDLVRGKLPFTGASAGAKKLKNIAEPVTVWHLRPEGIEPDDDHPRPPARPQRRWIVGALAAGGLLAGAGAWIRSRAPSIPTGEPAPDARSIAVLPFENLGDDKDTAYFADGVHEDLLTQLAALGQLRVVSRTSVMEYRRTAKKIPQIASELKVASILAGSIRRAGNTVRVSVQLLDARADQQLWAASYDRGLQDSLKMQSEIAAEIARALKVSLTAAEQRELARVPTQDVEAYELFLRHQALVRNAGGTDRAWTMLGERIRLLEQAVARDPAFAIAWAKLASEHAGARIARLEMAGDPVARAQEEIGRALALAPDDLQVLVEQGVVRLGAFDDAEGAIAAYRAVLARAPNHVEALAQLANSYIFLSRYRDAADTLDRALAVDARHPPNLGKLATVCGMFRQYERTIGLLQRLLELRPEDVELRASIEEWRMLRTGSTDAYTAWRKTLPPAAETRWASVHSLDVDSAIARRDLAEVHRLADVVPEDWRRGQKNRQELAAAARQRLHVEAWAAEGRRDLAVAGAREALRRVEAVLRADPEDRINWETRAFMHALLGERDAAFGAFGKAITYGGAEYRGSAYQQELTRRRRAYVHAQLGEREQALALLQRQARLPAFHVVRARNALLLAPLWKDPAFLALVEDPANRSPLPLDTPVLVSA